MSPFEIISPDREDICIHNQIPAPYTDLLLKGGHSFIAECSFGDMLFNYFEGNGFSIWKGNYVIYRNARVTGRANVPLLELSAIYENGFSIDWKTIGPATLSPGQFELYFAPYMDNTARFEGGRRFSTVDFHFERSLLNNYRSQFPLLDRFMNEVDKGKATQLFGRQQFSSPATDLLIRQMISYIFHDELAPQYYESYVHLLLIQLLERISSFHPGALRFNAADIEKTRHARHLLTLRPLNTYSIQQLCKELATNPYTLKTCFRYLFGTSIGRYKRDMLMQKAKVLLTTTSDSIDDISISLGYRSSQSFSTAFRNYYKRVPGSFRKI